MIYPIDDFILKGSEVLSATARKKLNPYPYLLSDHGSGSSLSRVFRWNLKPTDRFSEAQWGKGLFPVGLIGGCLVIDLVSVYSIRSWIPDLAHARQLVY